MSRKVITLILVCLVVCTAVFAEVTKKTPIVFEAEDYNGNKVTSDIFKDYDVTMINFFTTWCGYCIDEMPELNKLYEQLPKNANLIAICADAYDSPDDLKDIMDYFDLKFTVLKMTVEQAYQVYKTLGFPTSIFVDKNGYFLKVLTGAPKNPLKDYGNAINSLLGSK